MRIIITLLCLGIAALTYAQDGDTLRGPRVWLDAEHHELTLNGWKDRSAFGNHATVVNSINAPSVLQVLNFNRTVIFDGVDDQLRLPVSLDGLPELSVMAVIHAADTLERIVWNAEQSLRKVLLTTRRAIGPDTIPDVYGDRVNVPIINSVVQSWDNTDSLAGGGAFVSVGQAAQNGSYLPFKGALAELLIFDRALTFLERIQYETYLAIKYGTGLREGNLVNSAEKVLWNRSRNAGYSNNIAGIGRDDFFGLHQKQAGSAYDSGFLKMNVGRLAVMNRENTATLNNLDFIVWGDNGMSLETRPGEGIDSLLSFVQRKWLVTATGATANRMPVQLHVDVKRMPPDPMGYWLVIDRSGRGNFSADNLEYIKPDRVTKDHIIYSNVMWDTDGSGSDNFGFARAKNLFAVVRTITYPSCRDEDAGKVRIEVIAGDPSYQFSFRNNARSILREWRQTTDSVIQDKLVGGIYTLELRDDSKNAFSRQFKLPVPDALSIDLGPDRPFSDVDPIVLDVSSQVPDSVRVSYRWENSFGFSSTDRAVTVTEPGVWRVFVTKEMDGCVFTDDLAVTGAEQQQVAVYPTVLRIDESYNISVSMEEEASVWVRVYNARGIMVDEMHGKENSEYQFITRLKDSGVFLVVVQTPKSTETHKVLVH